MVSKRTTQEQSKESLSLNLKSSKERDFSTITVFSPVLCPRSSYLSETRRQFVSWPVLGTPCAWHLGVNSICQTAKSEVDEYRHLQRHWSQTKSEIPCSLRSMFSAAQSKSCHRHSFPANMCSFSLHVRSFSFPPLNIYISFKSPRSSFLLEKKKLQKRKRLNANRA